MISLALYHRFRLCPTNFGKNQIVIDKINPDVWMEKLGFDDEAKTWARAFFETLRDSDALEKYAEYYAEL